MRTRPVNLEGWIKVAIGAGVVFWGYRILHWKTRAEKAERDLYISKIEKGVEDEKMAIEKLSPTDLLNYVNKRRRDRKG